MPRPPSVSVLIPVLNEEAHLRDAAAAMLAQDMADEVEFLFIDGGSTDRSRAILAELAAADPRVRLLDNPARRTPHALNVGLRAARGEFIARMDAHTIYPGNYLSAGRARLQQGDAAQVSGPQLAVGAGGWASHVSLALATGLGTGGARFRRELESEVEVDSGFTGMWRRALLEELGGWDEEWLNDQDLELAARVRARGGRIVCIPQMAARYIPRGTPGALARQYRTYGEYRVKTARRHPASLRASQLLPPALVGSVAAALGPSPGLRRLARAGLALYAGTLGLTSLRAARAGAGRQAVWLGPVFMVMHLSYGWGFLRGCLRWGLPLAALARLASREG